MGLFNRKIKDKEKTGKKFSDSPNTVVFTTTFVIKDNKTITYVTHDEDDGAWQFFSDDEFENGNDIAMLVSLQNIVDIDPTVLELADMPLGYFAKRNNNNEKWTIFKQE